MGSARSWSVLVLVLVSCGAVGALAAPPTATATTTAWLRQAALHHPASRRLAPVPPLPTTRQLHRRAGRPLHIYPPLAGTLPRRAKAPTVMMLHGMCSDPLGTCDFWSRAGRQGSFFVCPTGNARCGRWADWAGSGEIKARHLDQVLAELEEHYGPHLAEPGRDVLMGFSRGAFVARDVAYARPGRYRGLIFIGAAFTPEADRLKASGIRRVVFAAGQYDCARPTMQLAAARMNAAGLPSRFVSLGPIYHQLPADLETIVRDALAWIRQAP